MTSCVNFSRDAGPLCPQHFDAVPGCEQLKQDRCNAAENYSDIHNISYIPQPIDSCEMAEICALSSESQCRKPSDSLASAVELTMRARPSGLAMHLTSP